jgi:hypothetical protein
MFIQADKIGFKAGDVNLYSYVGNAPIDFRDPFGENPLMRLAWRFIWYFADAQDPEAETKVLVGIRKVDVPNYEILPHAFIKVGRDTYSFVPGTSMLQKGEVLHNENVDKMAWVYFPTGLEGKDALLAANMVLSASPQRAWNPVYTCHTWSIEMVARVHLHKIRNKLRN